MDLLSKLSSSSANNYIEPREIFMSLPKRDKKYEYPRDIQTDVWNQWLSNRDKKDTIIKMNTGSGKTVVGLMILQSCLNEGKGPAVYVVPDNYLVNQVLKEAEKLGLRATTNRNDYFYTENKSILVTNIQSLVNGKSAFGMREAGNHKIGSIIIDDVHSCFDIIKSQFSLNITYEDKLYNEIIECLKPSLQLYNKRTFECITESDDPLKRLLVPFWVWHDKSDDIFRIIKKYDNDLHENVFFTLPLIENHFSMCNCVITSKCIEITPKEVTMSLISSFESAQRRIFMSATLSDDSVFTSAIGLMPDRINKVITPDKADDIGSRLVLFPRHLNTSITDEEIRNYIVSISKDYNVVVIVPSFNKAAVWENLGGIVASKENIIEIVQKLKTNHLGLVVVVNRYDGIDLPDDACRMLVIDGLPPLSSNYNKYVQSIDKNSEIMVREQIQRIEQGMGRGVRSNSDSCCIVLMGNDIANSLFVQNGTEYFSNATKAQFNLSRKLWDELKEESSEPTIEEVFQLAEYSLKLDPRWIEISKAALQDVKYSNTPSFNNISISLYMAYDYYRKGRIEDAIDCLNKITNAEKNLETKGYLMQVTAEYVEKIDPVRAQRLLSSARQYNSGILYPRDKTVYNKHIAKTNQPHAIVNWIEMNRFSPEKFLIYLQNVLDKLSFESSSEDFESSLCSVGSLFGFISSRPDKETNGEGCDNLWALTANDYLVIECKSCSRTETISKDYCNQLGGSIRWFESEYGTVARKTPIMIHVSNIIDTKATAINDMRIIDRNCLEKLRKTALEFATDLASSENWKDENKIKDILGYYKLTKFNINEFSKPYSG